MYEIIECVCVALCTDTNTHSNIQADRQTMLTYINTFISEPANEGLFDSTLDGIVSALDMPSTVLGLNKRKQKPSLSSIVMQTRAKN